MARHATARSASPGKGKKPGVSASLSARRKPRAKPNRLAKAARRRSRGSPAAAVRHLDTGVREGTAITFAPTGERLRVAKIEAGKITFEKLP